MQMLKKQKEEESLKEVTHQPRVNSKVNNKLVQPSAEHKTIELYQKGVNSKKQKTQLTKEELEFNRNKDELKFRPQINQRIYSGEATAKDGVKQIYGMDKVIARLAKGRQEAEFKKRMTERSNFAITNGVK